MEEDVCWFSSKRSGSEQAGVQSKEATLKEFSAEFSKASALLDFLMSEGHPYHIPDQIIDEVEAAREHLDKPPSKEDRAKLKKAYRDLLNISQICVTFERMPPTLFWSMCSPWLWSLLLIGIIPSIVVFGCLYSLFNGQYWKYWYSPIIYAILSVLAFWGFYVFTGVVTNSKLNQIIRFCYIFTFVAVAISILPFCIPNLFSQPSLGTAPPLGVLRGCAAGEKKTKDTGIPGEVLCDTNNYQWVINIGGVIETLTGGGSAAATQPSPEGGSATAPKYQIRGGLVVPLYVIVLALIGSAVSMTRRVPEYQGRAMDAQEPLTNVKARENLVFEIMQVISAPLIAITVYYIYRPNTPMESVVLGFGSGFASAPILLMIRGLVDKLSPAGTAKPSLISVRVTPPSVTLEPGKPQQFTAKVLGTSNSEVAWLIDPPDVSAGTISQSGYYVASGFPLEEKTVTITASSAADRTKSGSASVTVKPIPSSSITVTVNPASATLKSEQAQKFSAEVSGSPNSAVTWSIDPPEVENGGRISSNGDYVAPKTTAKKTVTITARSTADPTKSGSAKATVEP